LRFWIAVPAGTSFFCALDWPWPAGGGSPADADSAPVAMSQYATYGAFDYRCSISYVFPTGHEIHPSSGFDHLMKRHHNVKVKMALT